LWRGCLKLLFDSAEGAEIDFVDLIVGTRESSADAVDMLVVGDVEIPILVTRNSGISPEDEELAADFTYVYRLCRLVESAPGTLPVSGGWEDQDDDFVEMWLIYSQEAKRAEVNAVKRETSKV